MAKSNNNQLKMAAKEEKRKYKLYLGSII